MKKPKELPLRKLKDKAWREFSLFVRKSGADWRGNVRCYTCGKTYHYKKMHAGHFKHGKLDFDERNIHPQCARCNKFMSGRLDIYATNLVRDYGCGILEQLEYDSSKIYTYEELEKILKKYKELNI